MHQPLIVRPKLSVVKSISKESALELRRAENIKRLRRKIARKKTVKWHLWTRLEFAALVLMTSGLSIMAIKTVVEKLFS